MSIRLEKLIDIDRLQTLLDAFHAATNIPIAVVSPKGKILAGCGWQRICRDFHRRNPESEQLCIQSDARVHGMLLQKGGEAVYRCPHGLIDAAIPIVVNDIHLANLFTGQFLFEAPDAAAIEGFRKKATKWGFAEDDYLDALAEVPILPEESATSVLHFLKLFAEMIGDLGLSRGRLEEREKTVALAHDALDREMRQRKDESQKLEEILEGSPIPTFVVDTHSKITHWNRACAMLTGIPADEAVGTDRHRDAFYTSRRELMADLIVRKAGTYDLSKLYGGKFRGSRWIKDGYEGEDFFPKLGKEGKWLFFTAAPLKDAGGKMTGAIETLQDVTERRRAEQELRTSESRYRQLFESANDAIFILKDRLIVDCNNKALNLFGCSRQMMIGLSPLDLSPAIQPNGISSKVEVERRVAIIRKNVPQFFEWRFIKRDGTQFYSEVSLNRLHIDDYPYGLAIIRDITDRKKMIRALKQHEHELNEKSRYLEKVNQALKASLDHREVEKRAVEETILVNLKRFVFPYLEELAKCSMGPDARAYLNIIETNLNDVVSQYSKTIFSKYIDFTPTEVRIADLIRAGKNTKEIAETLALSPSSIQWHRKNIRQKLGLTNKKVNLQSYLGSLSE